MPILWERLPHWTIETTVHKNFRMVSMKVLLQDRNWLKLIGIVGILFATLQLSQCSQGFIYRSQTNAPLLVRSICLEQIYNYERTGRFIQNLAGQGKFPNPYPQFYTHSTRYEADRVFHYATSQSPHLKSYVGLVVGLPPSAPSSMTSTRSEAPLRDHSAIAIVCEATQPGATSAPDPSFNPSDPSPLVCSPQTQPVGTLLSMS